MGNTKITLYKMTVESPLHVGGGESGEITPVDNPFIKMPVIENNKPIRRAYIPSSTIKGKLRSLAERYIRDTSKTPEEESDTANYRKCNKEQAEALIDGSSLSLDDKVSARKFIKDFFSHDYFLHGMEEDKCFYSHVHFFGHPKDAPGLVTKEDKTGKYQWLRVLYEKDEEEINRICEASNIFGFQDIPRKVDISHGYKKEEKESSMNVFWNNSINRISGTCNEGALFNKEKETVGIEYFFTMKTRYLTSNGLIKKAIKYLDFGLDGIGSGSGKGDGRVKIENVNSADFDVNKLVETAPGSVKDEAIDKDKMKLEDLPKPLQDEARLILALKNNNNHNGEGKSNG